MSTSPGTAIQSPSRASSLFTSSLPGVSGDLLDTQASKMRESSSLGSWDTSTELQCCTSPQEVHCATLVSVQENTPLLHDREPSLAVLIECRSHASAQREGDAQTMSLGTVDLRRSTANQHLPSFYVCRAIAAVSEGDNDRHPP